MASWVASFCKADITRGQRDDRRHLAGVGFEVIEVGWLSTTTRLELMSVLIHS